MGGGNLTSVMGHPGLAVPHRASPDMHSSHLGIPMGGQSPRPPYEERKGEELLVPGGEFGRRFGEEDEMNRSGR